MKHPEFMSAHLSPTFSPLSHPSHSGRPLIKDKCVSQKAESAVWAEAASLYHMEVPPQNGL